MSAPVVTVLGGSTPFTAALVEALRDAATELPACELRLFGRDAAALERMASYARARLFEYGWTATSHLRLNDAAGGAEVVVNQIRFGGLEGRARDEAIAARFGLPADETLGPCGLLAALRVAPRMRELGAELGRVSPDAWVLNLSNPLSVTTAALVNAGAPRRTLGICELPAATVKEACVVLGICESDVEWRYAGLNHRGFITSLRHKREELMPQLPELLGDRRIFGIGADEIRQTGALPLKYFQLMSGRGASAGRARFLMELREDLSRELEQSSAPPAGLSRRRLDWYEGAVVPLLRAIFSAQPRVEVLSARDDDGIVREHRALVSRDGFTRITDEVPASACRWLEIWTAQERAVLRAVEDPCQERISQALALDPTVPASQVTELAQLIATGGKTT